MNEEPLIVFRRFGQTFTHAASHQSTSDNRCSHDPCSKRVKKRKIPPSGRSYYDKDDWAQQMRWLELSKEKEK